MTRTALPRYRADINLTIEIGAVDEDDAARRLAALEEFITERLGRSTFRRLTGQPSLLYTTSHDASAV